MNAKVEQSENSPLDLVKLVVSVLLVLGGIFAFYWFAEAAATGYRAAALVVVIIVAFALASTTALGARTRLFLSESQFELRKVIWPTRQETVQTTIVILVVVTILSLVLWVIDVLLGWVILEQILKSGG
jgi:preprotein translocase subunit SecE